MIVKVCGVRTAEVAVAAVDAGAGWIGIVFEPRSPRHADAGAADTVRAAVRGRAALVGVMVAPDRATATELVVRHRLDALQLHGDLTPAALAAFPVPVVRGVNVDGLELAAHLDWPADCLVLLDAAPADVAGLPGGTGRRLDLDMAAAVAIHRDIILAGGLDGTSVAEAVARVRPAGVDASSGLESAPGVKDVARVVAFVAAARAAAAPAGPRPVLLA